MEVFSCIGSIAIRSASPEGYSGKFTVAICDLQSQNKQPPQLNVSFYSNEENPSFFKLRVPGF